MSLCHCPVLRVSECGCVTVLSTTCADDACVICHLACVAQHSTQPSQLKTASITRRTHAPKTAPKFNNRQRTKEFAHNAKHRGRPNARPHHRRLHELPNTTHPMYTCMWFVNILCVYHSAHLPKRRSLYVIRPPCLHVAARAGGGCADSCRVCSAQERRE